MTGKGFRRDVVLRAFKLLRLPVRLERPARAPARRGCGGKRCAVGWTHGSARGLRPGSRPRLHNRADQVHMRRTQSRLRQVRLQLHIPSAPQILVCQSCLLRNTTYGGVRQRRTIFASYSHGSRLDRMSELAMEHSHDVANSCDCHRLQSVEKESDPGEKIA
jgi:hypothetical protein